MLGGGGGWIFFEKLSIFQKILGGTGVGLEEKVLRVCFIAVQGGGNVV